MVEYQVVNATQLNEDLSNIADIIRFKKGTTEPLTFPREMGQAIYTIPGPKEEQEKTIEIITGKDIIKELTPDEAKVLSKVNIQIKIDPNEIYNRVGINDFSLDTLVYEQEGFAGMGRFQSSTFDKVYMPNVKTILSYTFSYTRTGRYWLGSLSPETFDNGDPNKTYNIRTNAFLGATSFTEFIINSDQDPINAIVCDLEAFAGSGLEMGLATLYVPNNKVTLWEDAIYGGMISNFEFFPMILPISNLSGLSELPEEG